MTGLAIIYMHEREDGRIDISSEILGDCINADALAGQLMRGMLLLQGVNFSCNPNSIAAHPTDLKMQ